MTRRPARRVAVAALAPVGLALALAVFPGRAMADVRLRSDFNGDGYDDLVIAIPGYQVGNVPDAGAFMVVPGGPEGVDPGAVTELWHRGIEGMPGVQTRGERWGLVLQTGDFNGDGFADLAVGSPVAAIEDVANRGDVIVLYGSREGLDIGTVQRFVAPPEMGAAFFGASLASGAFNTDAIQDLAVGAPGAYDGAGAVVVLNGAIVGSMTTGVTLTADLAAIADPALRSESQGFGAALAAAAFNRIGVGPGLDDLAIAARQRDRGEVAGAAPGRIYVAHGGAGADRRSLGFSETPEFYDLDGLAPGLVANAALYASVLSAADFNGDGFADLAIGLPTAAIADGEMARTGALVVLPGGRDGFAPAEAVTLFQRDMGFRDQNEAGDEFAAALAVGDFDDNGFADLVAATPLEDDFGDEDRGNAHVVYGTEFGLDPVHRLTLHQDLEFYGLRGDLGNSRSGDLFAAMIGGGDFDGDGYADLAIGIVGKAAGGEDNAGWVLVLYGGPRGLQTNFGTVVSHGRLTGLDINPAENDYLGLGLGGGTGTCGLAALCMRLR